MSLKTKLTILFVAFTLIPLVIFGSFFYLQARSILQAVRIAQLNNIADLKKDKIETFFNERRADIRSVQNFLNVKRNLPLVSLLPGDETSAAYATALRELDGQLKPFQVDNGFLDVMLTDRQGRVVYITNDLHKTADIGKPLPDRHVYEEGARGIYFSDIMVSRSPGTTYEMFAAAPIKDLKGNFIGEVIIEIDMGPIYLFIQDATGLGDTGEALIARQEGNGALFLSPLRYELGAALKKRVTFNQSAGFPAQRAVQGENGSGITLDYQGKEVLAAWRYIPFLRWGLVTKIDAEEAFAPITRLRWIFLIVGLVVLSMGAFVSLMIAGTVTRPIQSLQKGTEAIAAGDLRHRVGTGANDEVGRLARAFDSMAEALERDIAGRKKAEGEVQALNEELKHHVRQLEETNKELEAFSYSVSHDLRSPLRSIVGFSHALLEDYAGKLDAEGRDYLNRVVAATQRMGQLIDDLLKLSRVSRLEMSRERIDLSAIAQTIAGNLKKNHPERAADFIIAQGLGAYGDERLLTVVLENLLANAWKFSEKNLETVIEFGLTKAGGEPAYFVKDNGAGFDMAFADKLFNPFQRLHHAAEYPGTGIGLATVKRVINRHGGRVWIEGEAGRGTTVYFTL